MRHAKIVCTLGPATDTYAAIRKLVDVGMDVARLNFSHGDHESHRETLGYVRRASAEAGRPVAVLADISGPKLRLGEIENGCVDLTAGQELVLTAEPVLGTAERIATNYPDLPRDVSRGMTVYADDGKLRFRVIEVAGDDVRCEVEVSGPLRSRKGLNLPDTQLSTPAITEKDIADIEFGRLLHVDYFAQSFVRNPRDIHEAKRLAGEIPVIAKIEKPGAVEHLDAIANIADGLMVARGDLGIEVGFERVPLLQKRMIRAMNHRAKPVITATQMLESMVTSPQPTRAEVSDVANALLDGTDAVMLSAESAAGKYPFDAVQTMDRIIREVEAAEIDSGAPAAEVSTPSFENAIGYAAAWAARTLGLKAVAAYTESGSSVALLSAHRPSAPIVAFSRHAEIVPRLALYWGVRPVYQETLTDADAILRRTEHVMRELGVVDSGDEIAITFGLDDGCSPGTTILRLWRVC